MDGKHGKGHRNKAEMSKRSHPLGLRAVSVWQRNKILKCPRMSDKKTKKKQPTNPQLTHNESRNGCGSKSAVLQPSSFLLLPMSKIRPHFPSFVQASTRPGHQIQPRTFFFLFGSLERIDLEHFCTELRRDENKCWNLYIFISIYPFALASLHSWFLSFVIN